MMRILIAAAILLMHGQSANASLFWNWSYSGAGISASGTFTTNDAPDAAGFYQIVEITGSDNGATITGLQPTGTPIPGNEPYAVDNLVSAAEPRLTAPVSFAAAIVPEPSAASLILVGLAGLIGCGRIFTRRRNLNQYPSYRVAGSRAKMRLPTAVK
jgi:hypothetical protein